MTINYDEIMKIYRDGVVDLKLPTKNQMWSLRLTDDLQLTKLTIKIERDTSQEAQLVKRYDQRYIVTGKRIEVEGEFTAMERKAIVTPITAQEYIQGVVARGPLASTLANHPDGEGFEQELLQLVYKYFTKVGITSMEHFDEIGRYL